jgi:hypothetical protein
VKITFGLLGHGVAPQLRAMEDERHALSDPLKAKQLLNMQGQTWTNRFLSFVAHKSVYGPGSEDNLDFMLSMYAADLHSLAIEPFQAREGKISCVYLNECGDWEYSLKVWGCNRSYLNLPKKTRSKKPCSGICRRCLAGRENPLIPWEDFSARPAWMSTLCVERPWEPSRVQPILQGPHDPERPEEFQKDDFWHNVHMGIGKVHVASTAVYCSDYVDGSTVDTRFETLDADWNIYCDRTGSPRYVKEISKTIVGYSASEAPDGHWHKGDATTVLLGWCEDLTQRLFGKSTDADQCNLEPRQCLSQTLCMYIYTHICNYPRVFAVLCSKIL